MHMHIYIYTYIHIYIYIYICCFKWKTEYVSQGDFLNQFTVCSIEQTEVCRLSVY